MPGLRIQVTFWGEKKSSLSPVPRFRIKQPQIATVDKRIRKDIYLDLFFNIYFITYLDLLFNIYFII